VLFVDAGIERRRDRLQRQLLCQRGNQPARHESDEVGAGDHVQRLDIAGHHKRDPPLNAFGMQPAVDEILVLAAITTATCRAPWKASRFFSLAPTG